MPLRMPALVRDATKKCWSCGNESSGKCDLCGIATYWCGGEFCWGMPFPDGHPDLCRYRCGPAQLGEHLITQGTKNSNSRFVYRSGMLMSELPHVEDARRMVACWNLLHNVPVQMMEEWLEKKKIQDDSSTDPLK